MTERLNPGAKTLMARMEAQETAQRARVVEVVAEIDGPTGTSAEWGLIIDTWATLTGEEELRDLTPGEKRNLEMAKEAVTLAFGNEGLIGVLQTYYGSPAFEKRETFKKAQQPQIPPVSEQSV